MIDSIKSHISKRTAFTLAEILLSVAIIGLLAALSVSAVRKALDAANRAAGAAQLRQIGVAIHNSVLDSGGRLPGPLWPGQIPVYDVSRPGRLAVELADYLGAPISSSNDVVIVPALVPKGFSSRLPASVAVEDSRTYVMNMSVTTSSGIVNPWGSLARSGSAPLPLAAVGDASGQWMLCAADQKHPAVASAPWRAFTPAEPIYGNVRPRLFFDGRVGWMTTD